jgi:hypothetical protein
MSAAKGGSPLSDCFHALGCRLTTALGRCFRRRPNRGGSQTAGGAKERRRMRSMFVVIRPLRRAVRVPRFCPISPGVESDRAALWRNDPAAGCFRAVYYCGSADETWARSRSVGRRLVTRGRPRCGKPARVQCMRLGGYAGVVASLTKTRSDTVREPCSCVHRVQRENVWQCGPYPRRRVLAGLMLSTRLAAGPGWCGLSARDTTD